MKVTLIILALFAVAGVALAASKSSATTVAQGVATGTPVTSPANGTQVSSPAPAPANQSGVTEVSLDAATSQIAEAGKKKKKKKR